jgi:magnesium-protoporphyrin IX monomethyl ester (oxidative) cyclase
MARLAAAADMAKRRAGVLGGLKRAALSVAMAAQFLRLYLLPTKANTLPQEVRLAPSW